MLTKEYCEFPVPGGSENTHGKVNILMQTYLSRGYIKCLSLASDMEYIIQVGSCLLCGMATKVQSTYFQFGFRVLPE